MGSYTDLAVGNYSIHTHKSQVDPVVMTVFRETDKIYRVVGLTPQGDPLVISRSAEVPALLPGLDEYVDMAYASTVAEVRQRLDVMGFTLAHSIKVFEEGIAEDIHALRQRDEDDNPLHDSWSDELRILESLSFPLWRTEFADLKRRNIHSHNLYVDFRNDQRLGVSPLQRFMLRGDREHWFGYPNVDFRYFLRAALEVSDSSELVEQDLGELVRGGYYSLEATVADDSRQLLLGDVPANAPILVLTEGSTDAHAIEGALSVLDPHLVGYYSFLNFSAANVPGGASALVGFVKAFAGAGVANRVVALFDNDTVAHSALRVLRRIALPPNIRVLTYPRIDAAASYPTIGPSGVVEIDVNGLAGSVEMYFGRDVLTGEDGTLTPVQWRGFDPALNRYQGEILDKSNLYQRFKAKIVKGAEDDCADWTGMRAILDALHRAFLI